MDGVSCGCDCEFVLGQNHRGAMMELGEGLCKLRKMEFQSGPFSTFEREITAVLDFIYLTQIELAACEFFSLIFFPLQLQYFLLIFSVSFWKRQIDFVIEFLKLVESFSL